MAGTASSRTFTGMRHRLWLFPCQRTSAKHLAKFPRSGKIHPSEYSVLDEWFRFLTSPDLKSSKTRFDLGVDLIVYLRTDPEVAWNRVKNRSRKGHFFYTQKEASGKKLHCLIFFFSNRGESHPARVLGAVARATRIMADGWSWRVKRWIPRYPGTRVGCRRQ